MNDKKANDKSEMVVAIRGSDLKPTTAAPDAPAPTAPTQIADSATTRERAAAGSLRTDE